MQTSDTMPDTMPETMSDATSYTTPIERLKRLAALKNYAIVSTIKVPQSLIGDINTLENAYLTDSKPTKPVAMDVDALNRVDALTSSLTELTYPVTVLNVSAVSSKEAKDFANFVLHASWICALLCAVSMAVLISVSGHPAVTTGSEAALALFLGLLGGIVYVILPNGGIDMLIGIDADTRSQNWARIILGGVCGFIIYLLAYDPFDALVHALSAPQGGSGSFLKIAYPLLGGYSVTLVVGLMTKAVNAVKITFGVDDKKSRSVANG